MLDYCLIYLPKPFLKQPDAQQPLGLMYLAASIKKKGRSVIIKNYSTFTDDQIITDLPDSFIFGITATSMEIPTANRIAKLIKIKYPKSKIILGGPGAYSDDFINRAFIDSVVLGEGEEVINTIYDDIKKNWFSSLYKPDPIDVNKIPFPARELLSKQGGNIFAYDKNYKKGGSTIILSSRGCPYKCAFCSAPKLTHSSKVRFRNPKLIRKEIKSVIKNHGIRQFRFSDDMFTASKKHVLEVCKAIKKLDIVWRVSCRVNPLDIEMLEVMKEAGCKELSFGIESFDNVVLKGLNKRATMHNNIKALLLAKKVGLKVRILFMIATPFQTPDTIEINKFIIKQVPYDIIACTQFIPIPGCDIWDNPDKYNIEILDKDLNNYNFYMFDNAGRRPIRPIIKIKDRPLKEFLKESEDFRDYIEDLNKINKG
jgi:radical SAM superfamily enzyme YgiQ (UPF0313 family)